MRRGWTSRWAVLVALGLAVSACTRGDDDAVTTTAPTTSVPATSSAPPDTPAPPVTEPVDDRPVTPLPGLVNDDDAPIADDPEAATGVLQNGLTYWVRYNDQPGQKASLRLAIRAGSAHELGPETGVAHFLEHMLFNGTERFPENELIDVLREFGAEFGPDINAYTGYDETVYELLVPNDGDSLELALDVLHEWLTSATLDESQVAAERGVVLDEWRNSTQSVDGRLFDLATEHYLADTRYAGRPPIGTAESIRTMEAATLRAFYDTWYRPDNAAVVVVGDVDVAATVALITERFGDVAPPATTLPEPRPAEFTPFTEPGFALHADPDQTTVDVEVTLALPAVEGAGTAPLRARLLDEVIFDALVRRLARDAATGDAPFDDVVEGSNSFVAGLDAPALYAFTDAAGAADTLRALLDEYERTHRYGFDADEIAVAVAAARSTYDTLLGPDGEAQDWELADRFVHRFLSGEPAPARHVAHALVTAELNEVDVASANARFNARYTNTAPQVIISAPAAQADAVPGEEDVLAAIAATADRQLEPRGAGPSVPDALMERPAGVEPTAERSMSDVPWDLFDPIEYTYPNGARVVLVPNDIAQGEVFLQASSPGGTAMVDPGDLVDALFATEIVTASGAGQYGRAEIDAFVSGVDIELTPTLSTYGEGWTGRSASADVEDWLALLHLRMSETDVDEVAVRQVSRRYTPVVEDPATDPQSAASDALNEARYGDAPHYDVLPDPDEFATLDAAGVARVWNDRFGDVSDWVFVFAGDFDRAAMRELTDAYIGTLPGGRGQEAPPTVTPPPPDGPSRVAVRAGTGETASVDLLITTPADALDPGIDALADVASAVVSARLTKVVREQYGDSYAPYAVTWVDEDPDPVVVTYIHASGSPERIDAIAETIRGELAALAGGDLTDAEFASAHAPVAERYTYVDNGEFLVHVTREAWDPGYDLTGYIFKHETVAAVSRSDIVEFLARYVPVDRYAEAVVTPRP